jgi:hypothetical protein
MNPDKMLEKSLKEHPEIAVVLEIAVRAREIDAMELPRDFSVSTEVAAIPTYAQQCV